MELIIILAIAAFIVLYRQYQGQNVQKFITEKFGVIYEKFAPYSFQMVRQKTKELGQEYTPRQYLIQVVVCQALLG